MRVAAIVLGLVYILAVPAAEAAKASGKVIITGEFREALTEIEKNKAESERAFYWNEPNGIAAVRPFRINLSSDIAIIMNREGATPPKPDELTTVKVHAGAMERQVIVTRPGSTIRFRNVDPFDHELYSPGMDNFRPEFQSNGSFRPIEFAEEGIFEIRCKLMSHFRAYVIVTKATLIVPVQKDGTFLMNNISQGNYDLKVFYGGKWIHKQSFDLAAGAGPKLEIKLKPEDSGKPKAQTKEKKGDEASKAK
ncbi:MAG: hypothetical protein GY847_34575 [Proteobacteria bacterium]|nr:hypothetical protein [Pseudomonadota bacterium]